MGGARDRKRIEEYYGALLQEEGHARVDETKLEERRPAVEVELRRRLAELDERYVLRLRLDPVALVSLEMPVLEVEMEVELEVSRRPVKGSVRVYWKPLLKELEPLACSGCGAGITEVLFVPVKPGENVVNGGLIERGGVIDEPGEQRHGLSRIA